MTNPLGFRFYPRDDKMGLCPQLDLLWRKQRVVGVRVGRPRWRTLVECYQGTHGISRHFFYFFEGRLTIITGTRRERGPI